MRISVIIPFYYGKPGKVEKLQACIESLGTEPDEILVIGNITGGLPWSLNKGLAAASGEYLIIVSDDMILTKGTLTDLCKPSYVTHPLVSGQAQIFGGCVCYPREVYEAVGNYDENFVRGYYDDDDYFVRVDKAGYQRLVITSVNMYHDDPGHTLRELVSGDIMNHNKQYFEEKWNGLTTPLPVGSL